MAEVVEIFSFDKGINTRKNPSLLDEGEMQSCSGFSLDNDGYVSPMIPKTKIDSSAYGQIQNLHRYNNTILMAEGENIRYAWDLRGFCDNYTAPDNEFALAGAGSPYRYRVIDYSGMTYLVNGRGNKTFYKDSLYAWGIENPTQAPAVAAGAGSNPNGTYTCYYTYLVKFPGGMEYETGPSPSASVTVSSQAITWEGIPPCSYSGTGALIQRKLYRYSTSLAATYYVATIGDNTTTTYSDTATDASLQTNDVLSTVSYTAPPTDMKDIEFYIYRLFGIKGEYLYWSEPYIPFGFKTTSTINVSGEELYAVMFWGDQIYIASRSKWYRLSGTDPDTWSIKQTFADKGIINTHTAKATKYGILGLWHDGIYLFDGSVAKNITIKKLGTNLFASTISDVDSCYAEWDGEKYYFYYPESSTTLSGCLIADFSFYPDIRFYNDPFIATAYEYHKPTGRRYMARLDSTT